ncbi:MAG: CDP-alcohol phosphatidyltransferase family protein [Acidimicrobiales bacterium]|nr:CDP-alcohol phosphatidyltransferase family protein [Acidimicrobiales bacterium]
MSDAAATGTHAGTDRIVTIPNVLTVVRLGCIPVFLWLLFGRDDPAAAAVLLAALGATDWVDGYVARHFDQVSELGKVLDPIADRLLLIVAVGGILLDGAAPLWFGLAVVAREVVVGAATLVLAILGARRIDVTWWGKAGTFGLMCAFPLFLYGSSTAPGADAAWVAGYLAGVPALALSYYAAVRYVPLARRALREGREGRGGTAVAGVPPPGN